MTREQDVVQEAVHCAAIASGLLMLRRPHSKPDLSAPRPTEWQTLTRLIPYTLYNDYKYAIVLKLSANFYVEFGHVLQTM